MITLKEFQVERNGCYKGIHTLGVTESNGHFYGHSRIDEGFQTFNTWYGQEMATSSNLEIREDGFPTEEAAWENLRQTFNVIAIGGGYAVIARKHV